MDISNQSSKEGIRIVLELKKGADPEQLTNLLYKKTRLEDTFGVNMLAVANGRPETLGLKKIIESHVDFQFDLNTRKYQSLLAKEMEKKEIQEGLIRACGLHRPDYRDPPGQPQPEAGKGLPDHGYHRRHPI